MRVELKPGEFIDKFVSVGPKNYAYRICGRGEPKSICKVRGITLNHNTSRLVNFDVVRDLILNGELGDMVTVHTAKNIKRKERENRRRGGASVSIINEPETKFIYFKRRRLENNMSVPFGYKYEGCSVGPSLSRDVDG